MELGLRWHDNGTGLDFSQDLKKSYYTHKNHIDVLDSELVIAATAKPSPKLQLKMPA